MLVTQAVALQSDSPVGMTNHGLLTTVDVKTRTIFYSKKIKEIIPRNYLPRAGRGLQNLS